MRKGIVLTLSWMKFGASNNQLEDVLVDKLDMHLADSKPNRAIGRVMEFQNTESRTE